MLPATRLAACTLAATGALFSPAGGAARLERAEFLALSHSIGRVEARLDDGRLGVGSAVTVARGILVTNCHVTGRAVSIKVIGSGVPWAVTEQVADVTHDICFLRVPEWPHAPVVLRGASPLSVGQPVYAVGFTAMAMTLRSGAVTALHAHQGVQIIETDTAFTSGASGGGLFDDEGALVGMLTFRMRGSTGHYFAVPMQWIRDKLPRERQWLEVAPLPKGGQPFWAGELDRLPLFMRAALLEEQRRWTELRGVAEFWIAQDAENSDAYRALGVAQRALAAPEAAVESFSRAVALAPGNARAWFNLGQAYRTRGNRGALRRVLDTLTQLDGLLARKLREEIEPSTSSDIGQ